MYHAGNLTFEMSNAENCIERERMAGVRLTHVHLMLMSRDGSITGTKVAYDYHRSYSHPNPNHIWKRIGSNRFQRIKHTSNDDYVIKAKMRH